MEIEALRVLDTNYTYVISCVGGCIVIDPGEFEPLDDYLRAHDLNVVATLLTHKHWDHTAGLQDLLAAYPHEVYGGAVEDFDVPVDHLLSHGEVVDIQGVVIECIHLPGHTMGACGFKIADNLFTGDVLFGAGCGRIFEGTVDDMLLSMDRILQYPDETKIYPGHEYTAGNLKFAAYVEPNNPDIKERMTHSDLLPSTLAVERKTNPFLRVNHEEIQQALALKGVVVTDRASVLGALRSWKSDFDQEGV
ncbi:hydroxyacylglutathione hydrolase [Candidatus Synchoanobacter obligatus]|uniref:Hydroxyacylglutathione hydrolase n=1 Tax=Candidatus Synchoanobacter obligatus TaxID=2919597 RepID=A0ABT1L8D8_9GAMM|nr:hydroxyacylglutathione hydrolase [Candidatus Synchoanobacter obligatus]